MPFVTSIDVSGKRIELESEAQPEREALAFIDRLLVAFDGVYALGVTHVELVETDHGPPPTFSFAMDDDGGSVWNQDVTFDVQGDPQFTINATGGVWRDSKINAVRAVRVAVEELVRLHGVTRVEVTWL